MNVKEINVIIRIASLIIAIIGLFVLIQSTEIGNGAATNLLIKNGGGMDTSNFIEIKRGYISTYRNLGSILLLISGFSALRKWE
jgi:hypothetical protein